jgi:single-strand DNA-binding protein
MANLNKVFLIGNLTRDPELRYTPSGMAVVTLRLAVNHRFKDRSGELKQDACFINVVVWDKQAETTNQYLKKGSSVLIEGRLQSRSWQDNEGKNRSVVEVRADRVVFLDGSQKRASVKDSNLEQDVDTEPSNTKTQEAETLNDVSWPQEMDEQVS